MYSCYVTAFMSCVSVIIYATTAFQKDHKKDFKYKSRVTQFYFVLPLRSKFKQTFFLSE